MLCCLLVYLFAFDVVYWWLVCLVTFCAGYLRVVGVMFVFARYGVDCLVYVGLYLIVL